MYSSSRNLPSISRQATGSGPPRCLLQQLEPALPSDFVRENRAGYEEGLVHRNILAFRDITQ